MHDSPHQFVSRTELTHIYLLETTYEQYCILHGNFLISSSNNGDSSNTEDPITNNYSYSVLYRSQRYLGQQNGLVKAPVIGECLNLAHENSFPYDFRNKDS